MIKSITLLSCGALALLAAGCSHTYMSQSISHEAGEIFVSPHGKLADGTKVEQIGRASCRERVHSSV